MNTATGSGIMGPLVALMATQSFVVAATLSIPVLGPVLSSRFGVPAVAIGLYASVLFGIAALSANSSSHLVRRFGGIGISQVTVVLAVVGLIALATSPFLGFFVCACLFGFSYAQSNTASGSVLSALKLGDARNFVFSFKQSAVPIGGVVAGTALPILLDYVTWQHALMVLMAFGLLTVVLVEPVRRMVDPMRRVDRSSGETHVVALFRQDCGARRLAVLFFALSSVQLGLGFTLVTVLVTSDGVSHGLAAGTFSTSMVAAVVLRLVLGGLADRYGVVPVLLGIVFAMVTGLIGYAISSGTTALVFGCLCLAVAFSWNGVLLSEAAEGRSPAGIASVTALAMTAFFAGGATAPLVLSALAKFPGAYAGALICLAGLVVVAALRYVRRRPPIGSGITTSTR